MRIFVFLLFSFSLEGAYVQAPSQNSALDTLKHQISNQGTEIKTFEYKLETFQTILEELQEQLQNASCLQKEQLKGSTTALEVKIGSLENTSKNLLADLKQLKTHANETSDALQNFKKVLLEQDKQIKIQNQNIENLSSALKTILDAFDMKTEISEKVYKIKSGDRLDKIAKTYNTTVKELMRINNLATDKIVEGKTLKLTD